MSIAQDCIMEGEEGEWYQELLVAWTHSLLRGTGGQPTSLIIFPGSLHRDISPPSPVGCIDVTVVMLVPPQNTKDKNLKFQSLAFPK